MKVWTIILIFGEIVGTTGPLSYDLAECEARVQLIMEQFQHRWDYGRRMVVRGRVVTIYDFEVVCVESEYRPAQKEKGT